MDALSIMNAHVPGFRPYAKELVDKTNRVRKVHAGDKHFVDLSDYDTQRVQRLPSRREQRRMIGLMTSTDRRSECKTGLRLDARDHKRK